MIKFRYESFGGIISSTKPAFVAHLSKPLAWMVGGGRSKRWDQTGELLSAPTEVHVASTARCERGCTHCYVDASPTPEKKEMDTAELKSVIDDLAEMGVFHVALGGGEALLREDLFEIAEYARSVGIVPNLTTSGAGITTEQAKACSVFGQINVSVDSSVPHDDDPRSASDHADSVRAIQLLREQKLRPGINSVLTRASVDRLDSLFSWAKQMKLSEIECLRFKPAGRARSCYHEFACTPEQNRTLIPLLKSLARGYRINLKIDCSLVPMLCYHEPDAKTVARYGYGCEAGNVLAAVGADGQIHPCSFAPPITGKASALSACWQEHPDFAKYREWPQSAPSPCSNCTFLTVCKGGCHVVSEFLTGDFNAPDPECPFVVDWTREHESVKRNHTVDLSEDALALRSPR